VALEREDLQTTDAPPRHTSLRIEDAALTLFYERGFKTTTMREIALACGLTPGALYNHFSSKDQLLAHIMTSVHRDLEKAIEQSVEAAGDDPRAQLRAYCTAHALFHTRSIKAARVASLEIGALRDEALAEVLASRRRSSALLRDILRRGRDAGLFDVPHEKVVANMILTMAVSIANWYRSEGEMTGDEIANLDAELALRMVKGDEMGATTP
jgi:AcrR family transcriptional regulator